MHADTYQRLEAATAELEPPFALVDMDAFWANARDMTRRAAGKPIRLASKSVRCRPLQERVLATNGFRGTLAFTLPEALWLAGHGNDDLLVAYPTASRAALAELARLAESQPEKKITLMVDSIEHLSLIESCASGKGPIRVCIDVDAGWWIGGDRVRIGAKRSPVHSVGDAVALATEIARRSGLRLCGLMAYEAQIAGLGDAPPGNPIKGLGVRFVQARSAQELAERRANIVTAIRAMAPLEFVNGGGTGSIDQTAREPSVTEIGAGSGLYCPTLFDAYRGFTPRAAAMFALPVVRRPKEGVVTVLGGGYLASGPADKARLPRPHLPQGLKLDPLEGAGEVQTPLIGKPARSLKIGDRVYMRHAKAGEMCERYDRLYLVEGTKVIDEVPTYRGEGRCFL